MVKESPSTFTFGRPINFPNRTAWTHAKPSAMNDLATLSSITDMDGRTDSLLSRITTPVTNRNRRGLNVTSKLIQTTSSFGGIQTLGLIAEVRKIPSKRIQFLHKTCNFPSNVTPITMFVLMNNSIRVIRNGPDREADHLALTCWCYPKKPGEPILVLQLFLC